RCRRGHDAAQHSADDQTDRESFHGHLPNCYKSRRPDTISIVQGAELLVCGAGGRRGYRMPIAAPTDCSRRLPVPVSTPGVLDAACAERKEFSALLKMLRVGLT